MYFVFSEIILGKQTKKQAEARFSQHQPSIETRYLFSAESEYNIEWTIAGPIPIVHCMVVRGTAVFAIS